MRFWSKSLLTLIFKISAFFYITPVNLNYWWNFGALSLYFLISQIITGIVLAMFYNPNSLLAYSVIMDLNNEIFYGWWIRSIHSNGASFFFLCVYIHMFRNIYYGSFLYPRQALWLTGMTILVLMIITAFLGYILPWGQMSFWGAMVITSLLASIPLIGSDLIYLLWGGFSIHDATLHRFYSLHFTLPFVLLGLTVVHLFFLHEFGSSNPTGLQNVSDKSPFSPYYVLKDVLSIIIILIFFVYIFSVTPDLLGHSINYERANFLITPPHIVPEWYLLFFYAVLRSVTNKLLVFFFMFCSLILLFALPYLLKKFIIKSSIFKPWHAFWFWIFLSIVLQLGWIGNLPVIDPYLGIGQLLCIFYFLILLIFFPLGGPIERLMYDCYLFIHNEKKLSNDIHYFSINIIEDLYCKNNYLSQMLFEFVIYDNIKIEINNLCEYI